ncbi:hypothetical protein BDW22DRAFT_1322924 [Trametopsis cervina]|nr:hypothetical protein BDW22DRAFT_1322924 [Trametopsis cervina]
MSPLTSPWLGAYNSASGSSAAATSGNQQAGLGDHNILPSGASSTLKRRTRTSSPGSDDTATSRGRTARKRQAALPRLPPPTVQSSTKKSTNSLRGGTKSANSTPVFPPTHGSGPLGGNRPNTRRNTAGTSGDVPGDSPSPVDLSMPPPATPAPLNSVEFLINNTQASGSVRNDQHPEGTEQPLLPVTPSSIMNLGRLGTHSSLAPPAQKSTRKGSTRPRSATSAASMSGDRTPLVSPALKPIRPGINVSGLQGSMSPSGPSMTSMQGQQPPLQVRKTSHKAAEQKRRDSLKTSFDDLRVLLPPIPLPSEEGFPDEPILPGAMPPRGPPKGNADGPNRGVSKLQLLRCGNDYIRRLKGRVERRDVEIDRLRKEIERLRIAVGTHDEMEEADPIDLTADLDAVEATLGPLGRSSTGMGDDDGDDDGE